MKTLREYIDQLDEISRRGFLKGAGAALGATALAGAAGIGKGLYDERGLGQQDLDEEDKTQLTILLATYQALKIMSQTDPSIALYPDARNKFQMVQKVVNDFLAENPAMKQVLNNWMKQDLVSAIGNGYDNEYFYKNVDTSLKLFLEWYKNKKENPNKEEFREEISTDDVSRILELSNYKNFTV